MGFLSRVVLYFLLINLYEVTYTGLGHYHSYLFTSYLFPL